MVASLERSRDIQMKSCDVIDHVTTLDPSEPSTRLIRSAPGDNITEKSASGAIIGDYLVAPLVTVSLQNGVNYANL